jgi:hypothetical protein
VKCCDLICWFQKAADKSVQTAAGKQLEGVDGIGHGAGNKKKMFEDKVNRRK